MQSISIEGRNFYLATDVAALSLKQFVGCNGRNVRKIPEKMNVPMEHYTFAYLNEGRWVTTTAKYNKAKLLLSEEWSRINVAALRGEEVKEQYAQCPALVHLDEQDKFRDNEGNLFDVRIVGERTVKGCFFLVKDVSVAFEMPNLASTLIHSKGDYERGVHYVTFITQHLPGKQVHGDKIALFLTYNGLLKVLFNSRCGKAESFKCWCTNILFTATYGSREEKIEIAAEMLDVNVKNMKQIFDKSATSIPVIYLLELKDRKATNLSSKIFKCGCTTDFERRIKEHSKTFGELDLTLFSYIDPKYIFEAETILKQLCARLGTQIHGEVFELSLNDLKLLKNQLKIIAADFSGQVASVQRSLEEKISEMEKQKLQYEKTLAEERERAAKVEIEHQKEMYEQRLEILRLSKDLEIAQLKLSHQN